LPKKLRKSKQAERPTKFVPTLSDEEDSDSDQEDGPITAKNIESRSRALDEKAAREAELDMEEMQNAALENIDEEDIDMEGEGEDEEEFHLPTAEERAEEKNHVADVHVVQRRMRECIRVLGNFRKLGTKGRYVFQSSFWFDLHFQSHIQATVRVRRAAHLRRRQLLWLQ